MKRLLLISLLLAALPDFLYGQQQVSGSKTPYDEVSYFFEMQEVLRDLQMNYTLIHLYTQRRIYSVDRHNDLPSELNTTYPGIKHKIDLLLKKNTPLGDSVSQIIQDVYKHVQWSRDFLTSLRSFTDYYDTVTDEKTPTLVRMTTLFEDEIVTGASRMEQRFATALSMVEEQLAVSLKNAAKAGQDPSNGQGIINLERLGRLHQSAITLWSIYRYAHRWVYVPADTNSKQKLKRLLRLGFRDQAKSLNRNTLELLDSLLKQVAQITKDLNSPESYEDPLPVLLSEYRIETEVDVHCADAYANISAQIKSLRSEFQLGK